jgi:hypothetical protein
MAGIHRPDEAEETEEGEAMRNATLRGLRDWLKDKLLAVETLDTEWHCICCARQHLRLQELEKQIDSLRVDRDDDGCLVYRSADIASQAWRLKQTLINVRRIDAEAETWAKEQAASMRLEVKR